MSTNKRQRISATCKSEGGKTDRSNDCQPCHTFETLPPEVLETILLFLPMRDVAISIRLVSRRCSTVATAVLNGSFLAAGLKLDSAMRHVEDRMLRVKADSELMVCSKTFNVLELIKAQYKMLKAVTWRYTHPPRGEKFSRLCFYAGALLDDLNELLRSVRINPTALIGSHGPHASVTSFIAVCKRFMNYFEKVSERAVNRSPLISGCKVVDLLDCLVEGRQLLSLEVTSDGGKKSRVVLMKLKYVMKRSWFTCLEMPNSPGEDSWKDEQRFMYLRLRRLVGSVNEHLFEKMHYDREMLLHPTVESGLSFWPVDGIVRFRAISARNLPRIPPASTYSGYGEFGGFFYYYGNMNAYAYENKFKLAGTAGPPGTDWEDSANEMEGQLQMAPTFELVVNIELRCTAELAPLVVRSILKSDDLDGPTRPAASHELHLKLDIACPASTGNRLPGKFHWELRSPRYKRHSS